jgi:tRNA pseudouridine38-40 synthase
LSDNMQNFRLTIQYDGTDYRGWQIQPALRTIQGELTRVLSLLDHRDVTVHGAGRTDAGVHAEAQVASFLLERNFEPIQLRDAINGNLDRDVRVLSAEPVDEFFHARFSAKAKTYRYDVWTGDVVSPFVRRYVHHYRAALDVDRMSQGARALQGSHDFKAFTVNRDAETTVRTVQRVDIDQRGAIVSIRLQADGFLRYMARAIVGTLIDIGRGHLGLDCIRELLSGSDEVKAGAVAPACGLTLVSVAY